MSQDLDLELICRDEDCRRLGVHPKHSVLTPGRSIEIHHRPKPGAKPLWERDDPKGLTGAVARASKYPTHAAWVLRDVRDDYGHVHERTVYRHIARLVARGHLCKLDLSLGYAVYVRPKSRWLKDLQALREFILGETDQHPTTRGSRKKSNPMLPKDTTRELTPVEDPSLRVPGSARSTDFGSSSVSWDTVRPSAVLTVEDVKDVVA